MASSTPTTSGPRLVVMRQESPEQEPIHKNGENKQLHSVIKNAPFLIELGLEGTINFHKRTLEAVLMYDSVDSDKPVHYVSRRPIEYNCTVDATGSKARVECTLNVLSSQHEGAYFRIRFSVSDAHPCLSEPIRVVSKPLQLKKVKEQRKAAAMAAKAAATPASAAAAAASTTVGTKRSFSEINNSATTIQDTLARIEAQQQTQQTLITTLFQTLMSHLAPTGAPSTPAPHPSTAPSALSAESGETERRHSWIQPPTKRRRLDDEEEEEDHHHHSPATASSQPSTPSACPSFPSSPAHQHQLPSSSFELHLRGLLDSYRAITTSSRPHAVRSIIRSSLATQQQQGAEGEMTDLVAALSAASGPFFDTATSDTDDNLGGTESWLSTEASSPMSPGESAAFSFNAIDDVFDLSATGGSRSSLPMDFCAVELGSGDDAAGLFLDQGWVLDQGNRSGGCDGGSGGGEDFLGGFCGGEAGEAAPSRRTSSPPTRTRTSFRVAAP